MKSTSNMIIYAETGEKPLSLSWKYLAQKFLFKWYTTSETRLVCKRSNLVVIVLRKTPLVRRRLRFLQVGGSHSVYPFHKLYSDLQVIFFFNLGSLQFLSKFQRLLSIIYMALLGPLRLPICLDWFPMRSVFPAQFYVFKVLSNTSNSLNGSLGKT